MCTFCGIHHSSLTLVDLLLMFYGPEWIMGHCEPAYSWESMRRRWSSQHWVETRGNEQEAAERVGGKAEDSSTHVGPAALVFIAWLWSAPICSAALCSARTATLEGLQNCQSDQTGLVNRCLEWHAYLWHVLFCLVPCLWFVDLM